MPLMNFQKYLSELAENYTIVICSNLSNRKMDNAAGKKQNSWSGVTWSF